MGRDLIEPKGKFPRVQIDPETQAKKMLIKCLDKLAPKISPEMTKQMLVEILSGGHPHKLVDQFIFSSVDALEANNICVYNYPLEIFDV